MKAFVNIILLRSILLIVICCECIYAEEFDCFLQSSDGGTIIGLPPNHNLDIDSSGSILMVCQNGNVYTVDPETCTIDKEWRYDVNSSVSFSPDKTKVLLVPKDGSNLFSVLDWNMKEILLEGEGDSSSLSFLNDGRFLLQREENADTATVFDLQENNQFPIQCENILQILEIQPEEQTVIGIYGIREELTIYPNVDWYFKIDETFYHRWNYIDNTVVEHLKLQNAEQYCDDANGVYGHFRILTFMPPNHETNEIYCQSHYSGYRSMQLYDFDGWNIQDGRQLDIPDYPRPNRYIVKMLPGRRWIYLSGINDTIVDTQHINDEDYETYMSSYSIRSGIAFDSLQTQLFFSSIWHNYMFFFELDLDKKEDRKLFPLLRGTPISKAVFSHSNELLTYPDRYFYHRWDFTNRSVKYTSFPRILPEFYDNIEYSPKGDRIIGSMQNNAYIVDVSSQILTQSVLISDFDYKNHVCYDRDGSRFLTASGNQDAPGVDNLIRIWDAETFEMQREIRGHSDSVWYAEFSPDDRRIVSASLDGTSKVWNAESGALIASFVAHASGVEYAAFFPDGARILSTDRDHKAYVWNAETAEIERTFDNIHLPAQLSPDGKYLFAGSEVWNVETGERIKTLDGVAQDYSCLTLSPDGTLLLTSEYEGFTKVWNVQEHILNSAGIWDYAVYE